MMMIIITGTKNIRVNIENIFIQCFYSHSILDETVADIAEQLMKTFNNHHSNHHS